MTGAATGGSDERFVVGRCGRLLAERPFELELDLLFVTSSVPYMRSMSRDSSATPFLPSRLHAASAPESTATFLAVPGPSRAADGPFSSQGIGGWTGARSHY